MAVMISIKPQYVEKIFNKEKIVEIRKTMPKCNLPCKVYIYETKGKKHFYSYIEACECPNEQDRIEYWEYGCGKVVAEFTLNKIEKFDVPYPAYFHEVEDDLKYITKGSGLTLNDLHKYLKNKSGCAWFIEDLKIYSEPKELSDFYREIQDGNWFHKEYLKRAPQSWCYVWEK